MLVAQGESISEEVNALLKKRLAELEGVEALAQSSEDYEALKSQHLKLVEEVKRLTKPLEKDGVYESLMGFAYELGLDPAELHNVEEITTKILKNWREHLNQNVQPSHIHLFITLLEKGKQKKRYRTQTHRNKTESSTNRKRMLLDITNRSLHAGCKAIYPILFKGSLQDGISKGGPQWII
jgi:hypothetical protein